MAANTPGLNKLIPLPEEIFQKLGDFIQREYGIKMPPVKRIMLESRLQKRLRSLGLTSFNDYSRYIFNSGHGKGELVTMVNLATTNKTDFFREPKHFEFLTDTALPAISDIYGSGQRRPLRAWSAGCSTGEEPYTLAMVLSEYAEKSRGFRFEILATDLATNVLTAGREAVYDEEKVSHMPLYLKKKYLLRSADRGKGLVRITKELRSAVNFRHLNFMDDDYGISDKMDIVFCRNVIIYFDRPTQSIILRKLTEHLLPGGYLFVGHSETLNSLDVPVEPVAPTIHRKPL